MLRPFGLSICLYGYLEIWEQIVYMGYCDVKHNKWIDRASMD